MCRGTNIGHSFSVADCSAIAYGMPHATATNPVENHYKYSGKELTTALGFNAYDFAARLHSPAFPHFLQPDPYAESYYALSPYTFCASNPINFTDPTGEIVEAKDEYSQEVLKLTVPAEDRDYLKFDINGRLSDVTLVSHYSTSSNYNKLCVKSGLRDMINIKLQDYYIFADNSGNPHLKIMGDVDFDIDYYDFLATNPYGAITGETGELGIALLPGTSLSGRNSSDDYINIIINKSMSKFGASQTLSHEFYGHVYAYCITKSRKASAHDDKAGVDQNIFLAGNIITAIRETINYNKW